MSTVSERLHESTIGAGYAWWTALLDRLEQLSPWLVVVAYAAVYAALLAGAASAALYLAALLSGAIGTVVFFTAGLGLVAAAPAAARALFARILDARAAPPEER